MYKCTMPDHLICYQCRKNAEKISKEQKTKARLDIVRPYMETYTFALPPELLPPVFEPAPIEEKGDNAHYSEYTLHTDVLWVIYQSNSG